MAETPQIAIRVLASITKMLAQEAIWSLKVCVYV